MTAKRGTENSGIVVEEDTVKNTSRIRRYTVYFGVVITCQLIQAKQVLIKFLMSMREIMFVDHQKNK